MDDRIAQAQADLDRRRGELVRRQVPMKGRRGGPLVPSAESLEDVLRSAAERGVTPWVSDEEVARYEAGRERQRRAERIRDSGIAEHLTEEMLDAVARDALDATEALEWTRRWVAYQRGEERKRGPRPILTLIGERGRGKTIAAAWLLASEGGRYVHAEELCRLHAARFGPEREECARILRTGVLVVDELGTEEDRARAAAMLYDVVDRRQGRKLTLLLGNMTVRRPTKDGEPDLSAPAPLVERYDARTLDRMRQIAGVVELEGASLRRGAL